MTKLVSSLLALPIAMLWPMERADRNPRQRPVPVPGRSAPVAFVGPFEGGREPVPERVFDLDEVNEIVLGEERLIPSFDAIESLVGIRSPAPTTKWKASFNGGIDPQVAVSHDTVAVLTWDTIAYYDKSGALLPSTPGFPNPTNTETLFGPLVTWLDQNANLNPAVAGDPSFLFANGQVGDARIAFDPQRERFLILGTAKNNASHPLVSEELGRSQRRTKFIFAISKTSDPHAGFFTYAFNGTPNDGACDSDSDSAPCPGSDFTPGDAGDYPSIGISSAHYVFTVHVNHIGVSDGSNKNKTAYIVTVNAGAAAAGQASQLHGHGFWFFDNPKVSPQETDARAKGIIMPAIQRSPLPGGDGNLLLQVVGGKRMTAYVVGPTDPPTLSGTAFDLPAVMGGPIKAPQPPPGDLLNFDQVGAQVVTAYWRGGILYGAFSDCVKFADMAIGTCADAIHLVKFDAHANAIGLAGGRIFGERNPLDEPAGTINQYAFPGVAVNKNDDLAVTYNRSGPSLPPEVRYSVWYDGEPEPRPSAVLQEGTGDQPDAYRDDTAGVAVDPFDDTAIWMAHSYATGGSGGSTAIAVGKVFGKRHFDLAVENVAFLPEVVPAGGQASARFLVPNRGDGDAPRSLAELTLVDERGRRHRVATADVEEIASGDARDVETGFTVPDRPGRYEVCVDVRTSGREKQYSRDNDMSCAPGMLEVRAPTTALK